MQDPPAGWKPALHATPQVVPSQVACALTSAGCAHGVQLTPHEPVLVLERQALLHACDPEAQLAQTPPQSTAVSFWFRRESVQESATQEPLPGWNPELQPMPQLVPSHVATPFATPAQGVQLEPQLPGLVFDTQLLLQRCVPGLQLAHR